MRRFNDVTIAVDSQACVARNGAWRDHSRAPSAAAPERFRIARTAFHRVVRRCQNQFWSEWQENITSLSRVNPRAAASRVPQLFSGQSTITITKRQCVHSCTQLVNYSGRTWAYQQLGKKGPQHDHTHLVRWPQWAPSEPSRTDTLEQWQQHFISVGSQSSSVFDEEFHEVVLKRFSALCADPHVTEGQFDGQFAVSELCGVRSWR